MCVVQAEHSVEAVERPAQFDDVLGAGGAVGQLGQHFAHVPDLELDLGVGAAEGGRGVGVAECARDQRHQLAFVGLLVRQQLVFESAQQGADGTEVDRPGGQAVGDGSGLFRYRLNGIVLCAQFTGERYVGGGQWVGPAAARQDSA